MTDRDASSRSESEAHHQAEAADVGRERFGDAHRAAASAHAGPTHAVTVVVFIAVAQLVGGVVFLGDGEQVAHRGRRRERDRVHPTVEHRAHERLRRARVVGLLPAVDGDGGDAARRCRCSSDSASLVSSPKHCTATCVAGSQVAEELAARRSSARRARWPRPRARAPATRPPPSGPARRTRAPDSASSSAWSRPQLCAASIQARIPMPVVITSTVGRRSRAARSVAPRNRSSDPR